MEALPPGLNAPDFTLHSTPDQTVSLHEFRRRRVILAFYPADWSPVCSDQMSVYQMVLPEFQRLKADLLGISVDGAWCHMAFARDRKLTYPLLSDFEPRARSPATTVSICRDTAPARGRCSCSTKPA